MLKIVLIILIVAVGGLLFSSMSSQPPLRGLVREAGSPQQVLLARARPAATFALDPGLTLLAAGWCDVHPESYTSVDGDAKLWAAVYRHPKGLAVTAVADGIDRWQWEAGVHPAYKPIRSLQRPGELFSIFETLTVLDHRRDPFCGQPGTGKATRETGACLVYRAKMVVEFDKTQIIAEYHEDLPDELALDIPFEDAYLNDFTRRARAAVQPVLLDRETGKAMSEGIEKMDVLDKSISRRSLAVWTGKMER
ncbi:MAG: DUF4851 domain-containing protein, partial [Desulfovibrionaceae bacterium]|nr:DUF4851 domain-containing protein [Desulfovibrionaceae bacterium]